MRTYFERYDRKLKWKHRFYLTATLIVSLVLVSWYFWYDVNKKEALCNAYSKCVITGNCQYVFTYQELIDCGCIDN